jgi:hypothetical protein
MANTLMVPMQLDALHLRAGANVVAPFADFARLPWLGKHGDDVWDRNGGTPWITAAVAEEPAVGQPLTLLPGVHLHWALPDALTRAIHPLGPDGRRNRGQVDFPAVPNRWLVTRRRAGVTQMRWIMESDYLWPADHPWDGVAEARFIDVIGDGGADIWATLRAQRWVGPTGADGYARLALPGDRRSNDLGVYALRRAEILRVLDAASAPGVRDGLTVLPWPNEGPDGFPVPGLPPYRYMGRKRALGVAWPQVGKPEYLGTFHGAPLTAVGYGEPAFAALYPNCRSVFGFHDAVDTGAGALEYDVHGWYAGPGPDILAGYDKAGDFGDWLARRLDWEVEGLDAPAPHAAILCYGRIAEAHFVPVAPGVLDAAIAPAMKPAAAPAPTAPGTPPPIPPKIEVAIGATSTEALSAYLADRMASARHGSDSHAADLDKRKIENHLEGLHLSEDLSHRRLDIGAKFQELRHEKGFDKLPGGTIWTVRAAALPKAAATRRKEVALSASMVRALHALNRAQRDYERARWAVDAMRWQIHADWTRYMRYAYPTDQEALSFGATRDHHDVDRTVAYLRQSGLVALAEMENEAGELIAPADPAARPHLAPGTAAGSLAARLLDRATAMRAAVAAHDAAHGAATKGGPNWTLERVPAPRFHQPRDPVVLLGAGAAEHGDRHGADGARHPDGRLECQSLDFDVAPLTGTDRAAIDAAATALERQTRPMLSALASQTPPRIGFRHARRAAGHPFMLEWEVEIAPVLAGGNFSAQERAYDPAFIAANWALGATDAEMSERAGLSVQTARTSVLRGRGFFTPHAGPLLAGRLEAYVLRRMREYFLDQGIPEDQRGADHLRTDYTRIRTWFVRGGDDAQAEADGAQLHLLQDGAHAPCMHGIATHGAVSNAFLSIVNTLSADDLIAKVALDPFAAWCIALRRAGGKALVALGFSGCDDARPGAPAPEALLRALALDARLRPAALANFDHFVCFLAGDPAGEAWPGGQPDPTRDHLIPDPATGFAALARLILDACGGAGFGTVPPEGPAHPFTTQMDICAMAMMTRDKGRAGDAVMAKLLRFAHFNGYFGTLRAEDGLVREMPSVYGLPAGGPIEAGIVAMANALRAPDATALRDAARIAPNVLVELKTAGKIASLAHLASIDLVRHDTFARIFHAADTRPGYIANAAAPAPAAAAGTDHGALFAAAAPGGHSWSDPILTALEAWRALDQGHGGVTQALTGFNDALLMKRRGWQLPTADPLGFTEYKAFTEKTVRRAVGRPIAAPLTEAGFHPIRSGDMEITRLNLVDTFGQINRVAASDLVTANAMFSRRRLNVALAPRLTQPARLNLRWLDAQSGDEEWTDLPAANPICGWAVVNNLDGGLMIYDAQGAALGSLDNHGAWRPPPGGRGGVDVADSIVNRHLRRMVRWIARAAAIRDEGVRGFMASFIDNCQSGLSAINPDAAEARGARAMLMSRPMALVRVAASIECRDPFAVRQDFEAFSRELQGAPRSTDRFEDVLFPLRLGEWRRLDDGVVGFWREVGEAFAVETLLVPALRRMPQEKFDRAVIDALTPLAGARFDSAAALEAALEAALPPPTPELTPELREAIRDRVMALSARGRFCAPQSSARDLEGVSLSAGADPNAQTLWLSPGGAEGLTVASVLMDPRALIHASTGILPTRALRLPPEDYVDALGAINVSFLTAPLLSRRDKVELPLPRERGWEWSWVANLDGRWDRVPETAVIDRADFARAFGPDADALWNAVLAAGWATPDAKTPDRAVIAPAPPPPPEAKVDAKPDAKIDTAKRLRNGRPAKDLHPHAARAEDILRVFELSGRAIGGVSSLANFAEQELIEGWLVLSPRKGAAADTAEPKET